MHIKFENHRLNTLRSTCLEWEHAADCRTFMFQIFLPLPCPVVHHRATVLGRGDVVDEVYANADTVSAWWEPLPLSPLSLSYPGWDQACADVLSHLPGIILWDNKAGGINQVLNNEPWFYWWGNDYLVQVHRARNQTHHCDCWISHFPSSFCMWPRLGLPVPFNMKLFFWSSEK